MTKKIKIGSVFFRDQYSRLVDGGAKKTHKSSILRKNTIWENTLGKIYFGKIHFYYLDLNLTPPFNKKRVNETVNLLSPSQTHTTDPGY